MAGIRHGLGIAQEPNAKSSDDKKDKPDVKPQIKVGTFKEQQKQLSRMFKSSTKKRGK